MSALNCVLVRRLNGSQGSRAVEAMCRKIIRKGAIEPVYLDFEGVSQINRTTVEALVRAIRKIGESRARIIGLSCDLWDEHREAWESLGPIAVPPLWT